MPEEKTMELVISRFLEQWNTLNNPAALENMATAIKVNPRLVALSIVTVYNNCILPQMSDTFPVHQARTACLWAMKVLGKDCTDYETKGKHTFRYVDDQVRRLSLDPVNNGMMNEKDPNFANMAVRAVRSVLSNTVIFKRLMQMSVEELQAAIVKIREVKQEIADIAAKLN